MNSGDRIIAQPMGDEEKRAMCSTHPHIENVVINTPVRETGDRQEDAS